MDLYAIPLLVGLACLGIAGVVALTRPFDTWRRVAVRLLVLGAILVVGSVIWRALANR